MQIFDGRKHASTLEKIIDVHLNNGRSNGAQELAIIIIGSNAASLKYVSLKKLFCDAQGILAKIYNISASLSDEEIIEDIQKIIAKKTVQSVIIQLPLPRPSLQKALNLIPLYKDIDLLATKTRNRFFGGDVVKLPPVVRAVEYFMKTYNIQAKGLKVNIIGEGFLVGKPVGYFLQQKDAHVKYEYIKSNSSKDTKIFDGDLIILATGIKGLIKGENIKSGASVIDFGFSGDLDMQTNLEHLSIVSPATGGMGPLVVRFLVMNHLGI